MFNIDMDVHNLVSTSGLFDPEWYEKKYPDVKAMNFDPLEHFLKFGMQMMRDPGPNFSTEFYLRQYEDIRRNRINPFYHYIKHGRSEGRLPGPTLVKNNTNLPDKFGNLSRPSRSTDVGKRLVSMSRNQEHFWYGGDSVDAYAEALGPDLPLPPHVRRILVIGHDFELTTGVARPISHFLNALVAVGGYELTSIELAEGVDASFVANDIDTHDFVIVNSIDPFCSQNGMAEMLAEKCAGKSAIYLHETEWGFKFFKETHPSKYQEFARFAPQLNFMCVSKAQAALLGEWFGARRTWVVYNTTRLAACEPAQGVPEARADGRRTITMMGTIQRRKGISLFSNVADLAAKQGLPWDFQWAGKEVSDEGYRSPNVRFLGQCGQEEVAQALQASDVFLLSSEDDPFPLAALEAIMTGVRVVAYQRTGVSEIIRGVSGTAIYDRYDATAALSAVKRALKSDIVDSQYRKITELVSLRAFMDRMNAVIGEIAREPEEVLPRSKEHGQKVAVVLHLYYYDLWSEIRSYLRNLRDVDFDLFVTLPTSHSPESTQEIRRRILNTFPDARIFECENRGMDIGPFTAVMEHINQQARRYDLILKIHSKKSLIASGEAEGAKWRRSLYDGLMGSPSSVSRILALFAEHPAIGMIAPKGMLLSKSSKDQSAGKAVNGENMEIVADRMRLADRSQMFFRGSMFWTVAEPMLAAFKTAGLQISDFDLGYQEDNSKAHAIERLFACVIRDSGRTLFQFDPTCPKPVSLLKGAEAGKDIYVIGSGSSCDYIPPEFFEGKCVVGVNEVYKRYKCTYSVLKEYSGLEDESGLLNAGSIPVVSKWEAGNIKQGKRRLNFDIFNGNRYYFFDHDENVREAVNVSVIEKESEKLVVSYSTITSAIHFAAYLGAANIIIVGHDCGLLDGNACFDGYYRVYEKSPWKNGEEYARWLSKIESQTVAVRDSVRKVYGCAVVSINPFINFGLEGHSYTRVPT